MRRNAEAAVILCVPLFVFHGCLLLAGSGLLPCFTSGVRRTGRVSAPTGRWVIGGSGEGRDGGARMEPDAVDIRLLRDQLGRAWECDSPRDSAGSWSKLITNPSSIGSGTVLLGDPRAFAQVTSRAGVGSLGPVGGLAGWVLKVAGWLGIGGMDMISDMPRWKRTRWLPVVLVTERNPDGSGLGMALTARTGKLLGDYEGLMAFMTRPLHWGGPERRSLCMIHPYPEIEGARRLGESGLYQGGELESALAWVTQGQGTSLRFRFFVGQIKWGPGELDSELQAGHWFALSCDSNRILDESEDGQPLWTELAVAAGGVTADIAKQYDLLG